MTVTITLKGALLTIIALLVIVLLIYIILLIKKLIGSLKQMDGILADTKSMTKVAADRVEQVDGIVDGIGETVGQVVDAMRGNQSSIAAATHIIDAGSSLLGILKKKNKEGKEDKESKEETTAKKKTKTKNKNK